MKRLVPAAAAVLAAALTIAGAASAAGVPSLPLPAPPAQSNPTASTIFDAMLAIARAVTSNPAGAQAATFSYNAAIQQYNAGDFSRSRRSALQAIGQTAIAPLPNPSLAPPAIPPPAYMRMPTIGSPQQADAESYVSLSRRAIMTCGASGATPPPSAVQQNATAAQALVARDYAAAEKASLAVINQCATALAAAAAAQQNAAPATPIPMGSYSPVPVATLIPDPALAK